MVQRKVVRSTWEDVRTHLFSCAVDEGGRSSRFAAVMWGPDRLPKLLTRAALDELCTRLSAAARGLGHIREGSGDRALHAAGGRRGWAGLLGRA